MNWTPPLWIRHVTPWWLLRFIDDHAETCWSGMAMWKLGYDEWSWWPEPRCFAATPQYDYCGKYDGRPRPRGCSEQECEQECERRCQP